MNLPFDRIHHIRYSYGRIVLPVGKGFGLARFDRCGWHVVSQRSFHNCRATGVY